MRILVATVQVPFIRGGAEILADGLIAALRTAGHQAELVTMPFRYGDQSDIARSIAAWTEQDFSTFDASPVDRVICLKFPTWGLTHPRKSVWMLHQHRAAYELFGSPHGYPDDDTGRRLRDAVAAADSHHLRNVDGIFTIAGRVCERLRASTGLPSSAIYHPPAEAQTFYTGDQLPYIFFPSRLEALKRQDLLIRAAAVCRAPVGFVIAGDGGLRHDLQALIDRLDLSARVRLVGRVPAEEMRAWYANALAVFFGPYDEDYGYVTLEAMLSAKPVITCTDSGGPLEFIVDGITGAVVPPTPEAVAAAIDDLHANPSRAAAWGRTGRQRYADLAIAWDRVLDVLLNPEGS
jgi:glycosyltransferase involved in cell wall biosynthesis